MNPLALIVLLGLGVAAYKNYTGGKLTVKILRVENFKLTLQGLQFNFLVEVNNPLPHELEFTQAIVGAYYNNDNFLSTIKQGQAIKSKVNTYAFTAVVPYGKVLTILPLLTQNKATKASVILSIEIQAGGYKGSASKPFNIDSMVQSKTA